MLVASFIGAALICAVYYFLKKAAASSSESASDTLNSSNTKLPSWLPRPQKRSTWVWSGILLAFLVFLTIYCQVGLIDDDLDAWLIFVGVSVVCSIVVLWREPVQRCFASLHIGKLRISFLVELVMLLLASYLTFIVVEMPSNPKLTQFNLTGMLIEITICFLGLAFMHFLFQRKGAGAAIGVMLFFGLGLLEYFVVEFRGEPLVASDVFALGTAAAVGFSYTYTLNASCVNAITLCVAVSTLFAFVPERNPERYLAANAGSNVEPNAEGKKTKRLRAVLNCLVALAIMVGSVAAVVTINLTDAFGITVSGWKPLNSYYRNGFLTSFIVGAQSIIPNQPSGYSNEAAEDIIATYAEAYDERMSEDEAYTLAQEQFEELQPTVIVIMDETFSDLSIYENLHAGYEGPEFFNSFDEAYMKGSLYVSAYGGGTCNSEFEFLTGASMAYFGIGVYPYMVYDLSEAPSMARQFQEMGYITTAIHPNRAANWNRDVVYPDLGFDSFLSIDDFEDPDTLCNKVTDEEVFNTVLDLLESNDDPQFIFAVTMQNHSSYNTGLIPNEDLTEYYVDGENDSELDEYLALITASDEALEDFIESLSELDTPVVLVYFGDHQPNIASDYNDSIFADEEDTIEHEQRRYQSSYMVWANYDIAGAEDLLPTTTSATSINYLAAQVMELIGAPLSDYQKCALEIRESMPLINVAGYMDKYGQWADADSDDSNTADNLYYDLWMAQYYMFFGDGVKYQVGAGASGITHVTW